MNPQTLAVGGRFRIQCHSKDGVLKWEEDIKNGVVNEQLEDVLSVYFKSGAATALWYLGLMNSVSFNSESPDDTMASHAGWIEFTGYSEAVRQIWTPGTIANQSVDNTAALAIFTVNVAGVVLGSFLTNSNVKSGVVGKLFATAQFTGGQQAVAISDTLTVTYTVDAEST